METTFPQSPTGPLEGLWQAYLRRHHGETSAVVCRCAVADGLQRHHLRAAFKGRVEETGGAIFTGGWRAGLRRPFGGILELVDEIAGRQLEADPALIQSYELALANLLPALAATERFSHVSIFRSGLAEFVLRRDRVGLAEFFWRRDASAFLISEQIRFILDAATAAAGVTGQPTVIWIEDYHLADTKCRTLVELMLSYAQRCPVFICLLSATERAFSGPTADAGVDADVGSNVEILAGGLDHGSTSLADLVGEDLSALRSASVLTLPFSTSDWAELLNGESRLSVEEMARTLERRGLLRAVGDNRYLLASAPLRQALYSDLDAEERRALHRSALKVEESDPFCASWHAFEAEDLGVLHLHTRQALERAWGFSAFDEAFAFAEGYLACVDGTAEAGKVDGDLLLALLSYDAGEFQRADEHFEAALQHAEGAGDRAMLTRLQGNNAIFGLGELKRGRGLLQSVLPRFEQIGLHSEASFVSNSIAFTLFREGRLDEAVALETRSIEQLANSDRPQGLLEGILRLNTGRLFRRKGSADQALAQFEAAGKVGGSDLTPYLLQLMRATLANLRAQRGDWAEALREYFYCLELSRELSGEGASYPIFHLLPAATGRLPPGLLTRGDEVFLYLHLNLGIVCGRLGLGDRAEAYFAGVRRRWAFVGKPLDGLLESSRSAAAVTATDGSSAEGSGDPGSETGTAADFAAQAEAAFTRYRTFLRRSTGERDLAGSIAKWLADDRSVALVQPLELATAVPTVSSLVLCSADNAPLARRLSTELNSYAAPKLRNLLTLPAGEEFLNGLDGDLPLMLQEVSIKGPFRDRLAALAPYHLRAQVSDPKVHRMHHEILQALEAHKGLGAVASIAFMVFGWDLATDPAAAIESFLLSSVDLLVLGDQVFEKVHGAEAAANLLPFKPRLSIKASIVAQRDGASTEPSFLLSVRSSTARKTFKLNRATRPILDLCDGTRTVTEIIESLRLGYPEDVDLIAQVGRFLRTLHRGNAICFESTSSP